MDYTTHDTQPYFTSQDFEHCLTYNDTTPWQVYQYLLAIVTRHECILLSAGQWLLVSILPLQ
jgi:hypothetical protein